MTRDAKGRFVKGNGGGPGRPPKNREAEETFYSILQGRVSEQDIAEIVDKTVKQAKTGNKDARKILFDYLCGAPEQYINLNHSGVELIWDWDRNKPE